MERVVLLRSLSSTSLASSTKIFSRSAHRLARHTSKRHRPITNLHRRSLLRIHLRLISTAAPPSIHLKINFSPLTPRAIATSSPQSFSDVLGAHDGVAEKVGFEKVSEEFIEECRATQLPFSSDPDSSSNSDSAV